MITNRRKYWWTHHPLEFSSACSLPAPHALICNDEYLNRNDTSRFLLDLTVETLLGSDLQLNPMNLSLNTLDTRQRAIQACEYLKMLLESDDNSTVWEAYEKIPVSEKKNEVGLQVSHYNRKNIHNNQALLEAGMVRSDPNPPGISDSEFKDILKGFNISKDLVISFAAVGSKHARPSDEELMKNHPSTSRGIVNANVGPDNFVDPATIRRPSVKRKPAPRSSGAPKPPAVPLLASRPKMESSSQQLASSEMNTPLSFSTTSTQTPKRRTVSQRVQAMTPENAFRSYPSFSSPKTPSSALLALLVDRGDVSARSNMSSQPYPQRVSEPSTTYSVSKIPTTASSLNTTAIFPVQQGSQQEHQNDPVQSASQFSTQDFLRRFPELTERWLQQQFASVIENPEQSRRPESAPRMTCESSRSSASGNGQKNANRRTGKQTSPSNSRNTQSSNLAKAVAAYQRAVYERSPALHPKNYK